MDTKIKQKLNITKVILIGSIFATTLASTAFATENKQQEISSEIFKGSEPKVVAKALNEEDRESATRLIKHIGQAIEIKDDYSFNEYLVFLKFLDEGAYLRSKGFAWMDLMSDLAIKEQVKNIPRSATFYRFAIMYNTLLNNKSQTRESYENMLVRKQSELLTAKLESDASESIIGEDSSVENQKDKESRAEVTKDQLINQKKELEKAKTEFEPLPLSTLEELKRLEALMRKHPTRENVQAYRDKEAEIFEAAYGTNG